MTFYPFPPDVLAAAGLGNRAVYKFDAAETPARAQQDRYFRNVVDGKLYQQPFKIFGGSYADIYNRRTDYPEINLDNAFVEVNFSEHEVIEHKMPGRQGSVKEHVALLSVKIRVRHLIVGPNGYPFDEIARLKATLDAPVALRVDCPLLRAYGVHKIVVKSANASAVASSRLNVYAFDFSAVDDTPLLLEYDNLPPDGEEPMLESTVQVTETTF